MGPRQHNMRRHRADRDGVVADTRDALIGGPVVGYQLRLRGHGIKHESMDLLLAKALDQPGPPRLALIDFDRARDQHLADPAAARRYDDRVVLGAERDDRLIRLDNAA